MHTHEELLQRLFQLLNDHDHKGMAACYHEQATFRDIAFTLNGRKQIHAMWDMICSPTKEDGLVSDIVVTVEELTAIDSTGRAVVVDDYTFRDTGKPVHNSIVSTFEFRDGLIFSQNDECDAADWAKKAFGGFSGFIAGHVGFIRRGKAMKKGRDPKTWVLGNRENIETPFRLMVEVGPGKESRWKFAWKRMDR